MKRTKNRLNSQPKPWIARPVLISWDYSPRMFTIWGEDGDRPLLDHEQAMIRRELTGVNEKPCGKP